MPTQCCASISTPSSYHQRLIYTLVPISGRASADTVCTCRSHRSLWVSEALPRVVFSTAAFHARVRGSFPGLGGYKETKMFLPHPLVKLRIVGSLRVREVAYPTSDLKGLNFKSCVWRAVSFHHPQEVLLVQFSLYVHKSGLKPNSFHCICLGTAP